MRRVINFLEWKARSPTARLQLTCLFRPSAMANACSPSFCSDVYQQPKYLVLSPRVKICGFVS